MTPEERSLVTDLFDRLVALEDQQRDPEAERLIKDGLRQAPNAVYALVQNVLVQEEALKQANGYIRELENALGIQPEQQRPAGFLDSVRETLFGRRETRAGSVPSVRPADAPMGAPPGFNTSAQPSPYGYSQQPTQPGGSFLGTAAAAMAGTLGGMMLGRMLGGGHDAHASPSRFGGEGSPWGGGAGDAANSNLARDAGLDDIGRNRTASDGGGGGGPFGLFGNSNDQDAGDDADLANDAGDLDGGGFDGGGDGGGTE